MKTITIGNGLQVVVDDSDYAARFGRRINGVKPVTYMHREIMSPPNGVKVDHRDGNRLNNTRSNLRVATDSENRYNRGKQKNNTSGYKGVYLINGKYYAAIQFDGKRVYSRSFTDA